MILLSVLIPSIPERQSSLARILDCLSKQDDPRLEVLVMLDNKRRSLGHKRNAMQDMAQGKFICHVDDDDNVAEDFVATLLPACEADVDVIGYDATCSLNGSPEFRVNTGIDFENEQPKHLPGGRYSDIRRKFWQWCAWRRERFASCRHPEFHHGAEDAVWLNQCYPLIRTHAKLDFIGYKHFYSDKVSTFA
jgi:glycosyltransferase involved in cell wall biosynthesis